MDVVFVTEEVGHGSRRNPYRSRAMDHRESGEVYNTLSISDYTTEVEVTADSVTRYTDGSIEWAYPLSDSESNIDGTDETKIRAWMLEAGYDSNMFSHALGVSEAGLSANLQGRQKDSVLSLVRGITGDTVIYYVSGSGDDSNSGLTIGTTLRTVQAAVNKAVANESGTKDTHIVLRRSTYREEVTISGINNNRLIIRPYNQEVPTISGSDVYETWTDEGSNTWSIPWENNWGVNSIPSGWESANPQPSTLVRRREMVFREGELLQQVLSSEDLVTDSYFVDESNNKIFVKANIDPNTATMEVGVRENVLYATNNEFVCLKGIHMVHGTSGLDEGSVKVSSVTRCVLDGCNINNNTWTGLQYTGGTPDTDWLHAWGCDVSDNGGTGMSIYKGVNAELLNCITDRNTWRGEWGTPPYNGWSVAGVKTFRNRGLVARGHQANSNYSFGFWADYDNKNVSLVDSVCSSNKESGVFWEASQGPLTINNCDIHDNEVNGVLLGNVDGATITNSRLSGNVVAAIGTERNEVRSVVDYEDGTSTPFDVKNTNLTITNCEISSPGTVDGDENDSGLLIDGAYFTPNEAFYSTLTMSGNTYAISGGLLDRWKRTYYSVDVADQLLTFAEWKTFTSQDADSVLP